MGQKPVNSGFFGRFLAKIAVSSGSCEYYGNNPKCVDMCVCVDQLDGLNNRVSHYFRIQKIVFSTFVLVFSKWTKNKCPKWKIALRVFLENSRLNSSDLYRLKRVFNRIFCYCKKNTQKIMGVKNGRKCSIKRSKYRTFSPFFSAKSPFFRETIECYLKLM